jgi:hypothetical protein
MESTTDYQSFRSNNSQSVETAQQWFLTDPIQFINNYLVNPAFIGAINKVYGPQGNQFFASDFIAALDSVALPIQAFRIKQVRVGKYLNYTLCPALDYYLNYNKSQNLIFKFNENYLSGLKNVYNNSSYSQNGDLQNLCDQKNLKTFCEKHKKINKLFLQEPVFLGYYFPYKNGKVDNYEDMGYVDIPKINPPYHFAFTGQMNGCHLVVSESPIEKHYRVWHYQSPGKTPKFTRDNFQYKVYAWLTSEHYQGEETNDVAAFNFLYYSKSASQWFICSQPHRVIFGPNNAINNEWSTWGSYMVEWSNRLNTKIGKSFVLDIENNPKDSTRYVSYSKNLLLSSISQQLGFNYAFSDEPILLNGMKVLFDNPTPTTPVTLQPKQRGTNNGR